MNDNPIKNGATDEMTSRRPGLNFFNKRELDTTETELKAIAKPANSGFKTKPRPIKARAAIGIPTIL